MSATPQPEYFPQLSSSDANANDLSLRDFHNINIIRIPNLRDEWTRIFRLELQRRRLVSSGSIRVEFPCTNSESSPEVAATLVCDSVARLDFEQLEPGLAGEAKSGHPDRLVVERLVPVRKLP